MYGIDNVHLSDFGAEEYPEFSSSLNEDSLFIHGTNSTGKSTTLDGIIYSIFGYRFIERNANPTDESKITLSNGERTLTIKRKYNQKDKLTVKEPGGEVKDFSGREEIWDQLSTLLELPSDYSDARLVVKALFLPQRTEDAPLRSFSEDELRSVILTFSSGIETSEKIDELQEAVAHHEKQQEKLGFRKNNIEEEISDEKTVIQRNKNRLEDLDEFISVYRSGEIFELKELLEDERDIKRKIDKLYSDRTSTYDELFKTRRKIGELLRYHDRDVLESAKETLSVLTCPVCNDNADTDKVESRERTSRCPFCGKEEYSGEIYETLDDRIEFADNKIEELRERAAELEEKKKELDDQIEQIKEKNRRLRHANPVVVRKLDDAEDEGELKDSFQELKEEYQQLKRTIEEKNEDIKSKEEVLDDIVSRIDEHESKIDELEEERNRIEEEVNQENIKRFNEILDTVYKELIDPLEHTLYYKDGNLQLDTGNAVKECTDKHTLGFSQRRIVDVALWLTLHRLNRLDEITALNFALVDDIYENIDNTQVARKDNLVDSLQAFREDGQLVTCSIDEELNSGINCESIEHLQYQTDLTKYSRQA